MWDPLRRLDTAEAAATQYEKKAKKGGPEGWEVFGNKHLYKSYLKRTENVPYTKEEYEAAKARDPEFYRWGTGHRNAAES